MMPNLTPAQQALDLYSELVSEAQSLIDVVPVHHKTLFQPTENSVKYYDELYLKQLGKHPPSRRMGNRLCQYCETFHLSTLKTIDKTNDLKLGKLLEDCFQSFLNNRFKKERLELS